MGSYAQVLKEVAEKVAEAETAYASAQRDCLEAEHKATEAEQAFYVAQGVLQSARNALTSWKSEQRRIEKIAKEKV